MSLASIFADFLGGELTAEETAARLYEEYTGKKEDEKEADPDV